MARTKKRADGRYMRQIYLGKDEATGKKRYKYFYAATQTEADRLAAEYKTALGRGLDPDAGMQTVRDILDYLISTKRAKGVGKGWLRCLETFKSHLEPLHHMPADKVRSADIQRVLNDLAAKGLSHTTLKQIAGTIRAAFKLAIPEVVQYNPCDKITVPGGTPAKQRSWLDEERQAWVRETPHRAQRAAMLMMYSGLRRGEATALTWADVDLDARTITVNKSWDFKENRVKEPKTEAGNRVVFIPRYLVDYLRAERAKDSETVYVLHTASGARMSDSAWKRMWESYMRVLNAKYAFAGVSVFATRQKGSDGKERGALPIVIRTFTPHELRHTFCTLLYHAGIDILMAKSQMGHRNITVTMEIYTHLDEKYKQKKIQALDDYIDNTVLA